MQDTKPLSSFAKPLEKKQDRFCCLNVYNAYQFKVSPFRKLVPDAEGFYSPENEEEIALLEYQRTKGLVYKESELPKVSTNEAE